MFAITKTSCRHHVCSWLYEKNQLKWQIINKRLKRNLLKIHVLHVFLQNFSIHIQRRTERILLQPKMWYVDCKLSYVLIYLMIRCMIYYEYGYENARTMVNNFYKLITWKKESCYLARKTIIYIYFMTMKYDHLENIQK